MKPANVRGPSFLTGDVRLRALIPEIRIRQEGSFDFQSEIVVALVADDAGVEHVFRVPEGLRDHMLHGTRSAGVAFAEDAVHRLTLLNRALSRTGKLNLRLRWY